MKRKLDLQMFRENNFQPFWIPSRVFQQPHIWRLGCLHVSVMLLLCFIEFYVLAGSRKTMSLLLYCFYKSFVKTDFGALIGSSDIWNLKIFKCSSLLYFLIVFEWLHCLEKSETNIAGFDIGLKKQIWKLISSLSEGLRKYEIQDRQVSNVA